MIEIEGSDYERRFYLSGPMTGYPEYNYPAFEVAAVRLRTLGFVIVSPHETPKPTFQVNSEDQLWRYYMDECMKQIATCDAIIMLRGWPESSGAKLELQYALDNKFPVWLYLENPGRLVRMSRR